MNMKKKTVVILSVVLVALLWGSFLFLFWVTNVEKLNHTMFTDITVFEKLDPYAGKELTEPNKLKNLEPIASYCREVKYDGKTFRVYAYEFATAEDAQAYCSRFINLYDSTYASSGDHRPFYFRLVSLYDRFAYRVERNHMVGNAEFVNWLSEDFEIDISELFDAGIK